MKCNECRFSEYDQDLSGFICHNSYSSRHLLSNTEEYGCVFGKPLDFNEGTTNIFTEPKMELYSVVCKIDTGVDHIHKEFLVNATSQKRALELAIGYFENSAHYCENIEGEPVVHVLRKEGVISSHQVV